MRIAGRLDEEEYVERLPGVMRTDDGIYQPMTRGIHQNGIVLALKK